MRTYVRRWWSMNMRYPQQKNKLRIRSKRRFSIFLAIIIILFISIITSLWNRGNAMEPVTWVTVDVVEGDTLWNIAKRTLPTNTDIRKYIREIREANKLEHCNIKAGQRLYIPLH